jgi:hypothetical protein
MIVEVVFVKKPSPLELQAGKREELVFMDSVAAESESQAIAIVTAANVERLGDIKILHVNYTKKYS